MNERIKELAIQAGFELQVNCGPLEGEGEIYYAKEFEKFAELIVQECAKAIEAQKEQLCNNLQLWSEHDYGYEMAVNDSIEIVNKHFGIKE